MNISQDLLDKQEKYLMELKHIEGQMAALIAVKAHLEEQAAILAQRAGDISRQWEIDKLISFT